MPLPRSVLLLEIFCSKSTISMFPALTGDFMNSVNEIRSAFLDFFHRNDHEILPSSPLVPHKDPTLLFTNAGMVQFKNVFTGLEKHVYCRAVTAQKCVRAGGKHNDLDHVGYTARHHTFFEMLGNFSFGNYFKEEAIFLAWNLLFKEFGLNKEKFLVTIYYDDDVAAGYWKKIAGLSDKKIIRIATSDNFWTMGDSGPCGPCSEIFYDHGSHIIGSPPGSAGKDGDRFIEIWNLVFMQYEQISMNERLKLSRPSIDTGMGLERLAAVLQGVHDNYDIDLFRTLIQASEEVTGVKAISEFTVSHRIIADHLRSSAFLIADGVLPSNEGRGYVLRRIMRRAMRHAQLLGAKDPILWRLLPTLVHEMGQAYPELLRAESFISETLKLEETRFCRTLEHGLNLLEDLAKDVGDGECFDGEVAFKLYDTYGFPLDLTRDVLHRRGITVDIAGFDKAMTRQKVEARANWSGSGNMATEKVWFTVYDQVGASKFLGYETEQAEAFVTALVCDGQIIADAREGDDCAVIVNQTPFYGESSGQVGDQGIISGENFIFDVSNTTKMANIFAHLGRSLVTSDRLRFDFSHPKAVTCEELARIEELVNNIVLQNDEVTVRLLAVDDAIAEGAIALFGEKYGDEVRVVSMGKIKNKDKDRQRYNPYLSSELCGGTHVRRTGDIGLIHIIAEGAISSGVRRIEALTGKAAQHYLVEKKEQLAGIAAILKSTLQDAYSRTCVLIDKCYSLSKELDDTRRKLALSNQGKSSSETLNGFAFLGQIVSGISSRELKSLADTGKKQLGSGVVVFISVNASEKASIVVGVTEDLTVKINAIDLVRIGAAALGGQGGGGRPDLAQAGGPLGGSAEKAIARIRKKLETVNIG